MPLVFSRSATPAFRPLLRKLRYSTLSQLPHAKRFIDVHPEVQEALATNKPVVALETTLITHGFPYPRNLELGLELEDIVRKNGSIPATIGFVGGRIKIGMEKSEIDRLADRQNNPTLVKVSRRDFGPVIASGLDGGTTCSATLILAAMAGIKVFATGGLGGVHRGGESSMDISADLQDLSRCPVGLVSSGVKSILDIGRTLEYLETLGVPVISYANGHRFPAFFSRDSGFKAPWDAPDPISAAKILFSQNQLGLQHGALIAVPIPEEYESTGARIQKLVDQAVAESEANGMSKGGKEVTPWLLNRIGELSGGDSKENNIALLKNTALVGSQIAVQYQNLMNTENDSFVSFATAEDVNQVSSADVREQDAGQPSARLFVVGSAAIDLTATAIPVADDSHSKHSTTPGTVSFTLGGVARNVAEASHRVIRSRSWDFSSLLVAPVGNDGFGTLLRTELEKLGMRTDGLISTDSRTAICNMLLDHGGNLIGGVADMDITKSLDASQVLTLVQQHQPTMVVIDGNLSPDTILAITNHCVRQNIPVFFEPTSVLKSTSILPAIASNFGDNGVASAPIAFTSPNRQELAHMYQSIRASTHELMNHPAWWSVIDSFSIDTDFRNDLQKLSRKAATTDSPNNQGHTLSFLAEQGIVQMAIQLLPFFQHIVIKCGNKGVLVVMRTRSPRWLQTRSDVGARLVVAHGTSGESVVVHHSPATRLDSIVNVTGAGDSLVGALLAQLVQNPRLLDAPQGFPSVFQLAQKAAVFTLQSSQAVSPRLSAL